MTMIEVVLIGAGVLLMASALDNTPLVATFQKIISGQSVDWSGQGAQASTNHPTTPPGVQIVPTPPNANQWA